MRVMKDSGIWWIGTVPQSWSVIKAKYCITVSNGSDPVTEGDIPVYGSGEKQVKTCGEFKEPPAVLLGRKGTINNPKYIDSKYWNVDTAFDVKSIGGFQLRYYYYLSMSFDYEYYTSQTTLPSMTQTAYENMYLPAPQFCEQQQIVSYLDGKCLHIENVIRKTKESIEEYKNLRQSVIAQAVTKGVRGDRPLRDSGNIWFGEIPVEWNAKKLKYQFHIKKEIAGEEGHTVLSITQRGIIPKDLSKNEGQLAESYANYQLVNAGDFAMNHMDLLTGWVDISKYEGVTSPDYRVFVLDDAENNHSQYFLYLMQMCYSNRIFYGLGQGVSSLGRWRLQADKFLNFVIPIPPLEEQKEIATYLDGKCSEIDTLISKKELFLVELEKYKKSMIYEYVTGKKEVPHS